MDKSLVNAWALQGCVVKHEALEVPILDISFIRVVTARSEALEAVLENSAQVVDLILDRCHFKAEVSLRAKGEGWLRLGFDKIVPSQRAMLRSFLSPKKVGESLVEDWRNEKLRHFHGLNESELWFDADGGVLFTYLDQDTPDAQFVFRVHPNGQPSQIGNVRRSDYMELKDLSMMLPLLPMGDRDVYKKLGECRDVITNLRPAGQVEYHLKQKLLKTISDSLYSTGHRVDVSSLRPKSQPPVTPSPNPGMNI